MPTPVKAPPRDPESPSACPMGVCARTQVLYAAPSNRGLSKTPKDVYMPNYEDVTISTRDGKRLRGWLIKRKEPRLHPTIIHFHGNACNISHMLYDALGMFQKVPLPYDVFPL